MHAGGERAARAMFLRWKVCKEEWESAELSELFHMFARRVCLLAASACAALAICMHMHKPREYALGARPPRDGGAIFWFTHIGEFVLLPRQARFYG